MAQSRLASVPNISIPRSRWKQPFNHSTTFDHGYLVPIDCFDILPGDTYKIDLASLIWMSNPIRPIFGNITAHVDVMFCPMRLVWDKTKKFFGENENSYGPVSSVPKIPTVGLGALPSATSEHLHVKYDSLSHYLGKPICDITAGMTAANLKYVSILKERAMCLIWNNYYRAQQWQAPAIIETGGDGHYATSNQNYITISGSPVARRLDSPCFKVNKEFDYFTAGTAAPQFGNSVNFLAGMKAPLKAGSDLNAAGGYIKFSNNNVSPITGYLGLAGSNGLGYNNGTPGAFTSQGSPLTYTNLYADLGAATEATINNLRYAFAVQKYLERSNFGSRFFEMLEVHYGVTSPDATLQIPQRIGHADFPINISTVLSTAGATDDQTSALGMPGASSCTATKKYLTTHAFTEPGFLFVLISTTHERSYTQGILREDLKDEWYQIYSPEFANLGDQATLSCELFYGDDADNDKVLNYQEHWAEYRYRPHRVSGLLDPQAPNSLDFWVLTENLTQRVGAGEMAGFLVEDRDNLARCLVSGSAGPDYVGDFYLPYIATREMPLFTIPGLIDHFGVR